MTTVTAGIADTSAGGGRLERPSFARSKVFMDTPITIEVVGDASYERLDADVEAAFSWFAEVERRCSRFDRTSELMQLCARPGEAVSLSPLLFAAVRFAVSMAELTGGAFDPTVGGAMARRGFNTNFRTGETVPAPDSSDGPPSYRDVLVDPSNESVMLLRPLTLDLGGVAKGFAIDLAAQALNAYPDFAINAGGDVLARGCTRTGEPWAIGIRHPRELRSLAEIVEISGAAVCTSGDYERTAADGGSHILDAASETGAGALASATVIAPTAMVADAFATAAFVLGPEQGIELLTSQGLAGFLITPDLGAFETESFAEFRQ